jgi:hypothetical protein
LSSQAIDHHGAEFHSLDQVHGDDRYAVHGSFDLVGQLDGSGLDATSGAVQLPITTDENADFVGQHRFGDNLGESFS